MSKHETWMTRQYWEIVGGTLYEEFQAVPRTQTSARRLLDGVILPDGPREIRHWRDANISGKDVVVIQTKAIRLGMYLMGQALFSAELIKSFSPHSVRSVILCAADDSVMRGLLEPYPHIEVIVIPGIAGGSSNGGLP